MKTAGIIPTTFYCGLFFIFSFLTACSAARPAEEWPDRLLYAWVSHRTGIFESRLVVNNPGEDEARVRLTARRGNGESETVERTIKGRGFLEETAGNLFPTLGSGEGFSVLAASSSPNIRGRWVTHNLRSASGHSPSQGVAARISGDGSDPRTGHRLVFTYLPVTRGFFSAAVIVNVGKQPAPVNLALYNEAGKLVGEKAISGLIPFRPHPVMVNEVLSSDVGTAYMVATSDGTPLSGVSFLFDSAFGEPAIENATAVSTGRPDPKTYVYPWLSSNSGIFESILLAVNHGEEETVCTLTAQRENGDREETVIKIPAHGFFEENVSSLFPQLGSGRGYTVTLKASTTHVTGGWVTHNLMAASGRSPSQSAAVGVRAGGPPDERVGRRLLFGLLPNGGNMLSAPVVVNVGDGPTDVTLSFLDEKGRLVSEKVYKGLAPMRPLARITGDLVGKDTGSLQMVAASSQEPITGTAFVFDRVHFEPAIGNASGLEEADPSALSLAPCRLEGLDETVLCGTYPVRENRESLAGRKIELNIVVLPATGEQPAPDPLFILAGGPGGAATRRAAGNAVEYAKLRRDRDVVMVDQRGTGASHPLPCSYFGDPDSAQTYLIELHPEDYVRRCLEELQQKADLRFYHTAVAMDDLDEVRAALGYEQINLLGRSYGTRSGYVYMRRHPSRVRSAVLIHVNPPDIRVPTTLAPNVRDAMERLYADCAADPACAVYYPDLPGDLEKVLTRLKQGPVQVRITNPFTQQEETVSFGLAPFRDAMRSLLGRASSFRWIPALIYWAARGDYTELAIYTAEYRRGIHEALNGGMYHCVTCTEDHPFVDFDEARRLAEGSFLGEYRIRQQLRACSIWPAGDAPYGFTDLVPLEIPALLISGELDPFTPPSMGARLNAVLSQGLQIIIPNEGHGTAVVWQGCLDDALAEFLARGSWEDIDFSCVLQNKAPSFASPQDLKKAR